MSIYYTKDMLAVCRINHYVFVNGQLKKRKLSENWHKSLNEKGKTPYKNAHCEVIRVYQYRHKDVHVPANIGVINAVERLVFETDSNGFTTVPVGDVTLTSVSWKDFKAVMRAYFKQSDALYFTLDFARKNNPLLREMTWSDLDACPDDATVYEMGPYARHIDKINAVKDAEKQAKKQLHAMRRGGGPHPVYLVHDVECLLYELREVIRKAQRSVRSDLQYMIASFLLIPLDGAQYRDNSEHIDKIVLAIEHYLSGIYALFVREALSGYTLQRHERALLSHIRKVKSSLLDSGDADILVSNVSQSLFLPVDVHGYHTVPIFSEYKFALSTFHRGQS